VEEKHDLILSSLSSWVVALVLSSSDENNATGDVVSVVVVDEERSERDDVPVEGVTAMFVGLEVTFFAPLSESEKADLRD
jgi:hypothetical protein